MTLPHTERALILRRQDVHDEPDGLGGEGGAGGPQSPRPPQVESGVCSGVQ